MSDIFAELDQYDYLPEAEPKSAGHFADGMRGQLTSPQDVARYVRAGNATVTLQSLKTGTRFTYKIKDPEESRGGVVFFVGLLSGPDSTSNYTYLGSVKDGYNGERFQLTKGSKVGKDAPSFKAFEYFWRAVVIQQRPYDNWGLEVWHEGRCSRCNRPLTVPESIAVGMGSKCRAAVGL